MATMLRLWGNADKTDVGSDALSFRSYETRHPSRYYGYNSKAVLAQHEFMMRFTGKTGGALFDTAAATRCWHS